MANSLASATSSRVDSASKHIVPCKVNTDYMTSGMHMSHSDATRELQANKMSYCMHKDDVVIGLGRATYGVTQNASMKKAYPSVLTTLKGTNKHVLQWQAVTNFLTERLGDIDDIKNSFQTKVESQSPEEYADSEGLKAYTLALAAQNAAGVAAAPAELFAAAARVTAHDLALLNTPAGFATVEEHAELTKLKPNPKMVFKSILNMLDLHFVGISLGTAYAHAHSGDTVASVMIGGLKTVLNGAYQVHTNDLLMFYFDEEAHFFETGGSRRERRGNLARGAYCINKPIYLK
jgi:hypothetical protein